VIPSVRSSPGYTGRGRGSGHCCQPVQPFEMLMRVMGKQEENDAL